ncbi:hypothetical protein H6788_01280 [Candidatus Nomurabacteria bacterium]|nr:hypothetical protein [Candidatus Nomurabacteria bacterium]
MSTWVAAIAVVVFGAYAYMDAHIGSESKTPSLSIETVIEADQTERAVETAYSRILPMLGAFQE